MAGQEQNRQNQGQGPNQGQSDRQTPNRSEQQRNKGDQTLNKGEQSQNRGPKQGGQSNQGERDRNR